eukprot:m.1101404 g.1101404  ORF g.1101404 m.1101404 type:complete len:424 (+) comp24323_c0_seq3:207-1478(+)
MSVVPAQQVSHKRRAGSPESVDNSATKRRSVDSHPDLKNTTPKASMEANGVHGDPAGYEQDGSAAENDELTTAQRRIQTETVTIRAIIAGKYTGSIIGKGGQTISWIRSQSEAKVNISDMAAVDERIISCTGTAEAIFRAFSFICDKLREAIASDREKNNPMAGDSRHDVSLRLAIPQSQAGAIIGKQGSKIREIREATGASISMEKDVLPHSNERPCVIAGTTASVAQSIFHITCTMVQVPAKGASIPYIPGAGLPAGQFGGGPLMHGGGGAVRYPAGGNAHQGPHHHHHHAPPTYPFGPPEPFGPGDKGGMPPGMYRGPAPGPHHPYGGGTARTGIVGGVTQQLSVPDDIAGALIGKGGYKINEIRQMSQAHVKIAERVPGASERVVTVTGTPEAVQLAIYLVQTRMQEALMANGMGAPMG